VHDRETPSWADIDENGRRFCASLDEIVRTVDAIGRDVESRTGFQYKGLDISIAPFPDRRRSIAVSTN